jgi:hypothetical protein
MNTQLFTPIYIERLYLAPLGLFSSCGFPSKKKKKKKIVKDYPMIIPAKFPSNFLSGFREED